MLLLGVGELDHAHIVNLLLIERAKDIALNISEQLYQFHLAAFNCIVSARELEDAIAFRSRSSRHEHVAARALEKRLYCVAVDSDNCIRVDILDRQVVKWAFEGVYLTEAHLEQTLLDALVVVHDVLYEDPSVF